jgi:hypothetical protein
MFDKLEVLSENKELMMKERMIFEERMQEVAYENTLMAKKVENLQQQLQSSNYAYQ